MPSIATIQLVHYHQTCFCTPSKIQESFTRRDLLSCAQLCTRSLCQTSYNHNPACALRALGLLLADGASIMSSATLFFTTTTITRKRKVKKTIPRCKMIHFSEGYKRAVVKIWGRKAKKGFSGQKPSFQAQKKSTSWRKPCSSLNREKLCKQKSTLFPNRYQSFSNFRVFL